jgi:very-short-patch-repair endonuclease
MRMTARHGSCAGGLRSARIRADLVEVLMFGRALVSPARALLLEERARVMRCNPTRSEEWLWRRLSGSRTGFAFRRQLVIGEHIVDFACTKVRLVVEVDGGYHEQRARHDAARDRALNGLRWHVLRLGEQEVFAQLEDVLAHIAATARRLAWR